MNMTISEPRTISRQQRRHLERQAAKRAERTGPRPATPRKPPSGPVWNNYKALTEHAYERLARNMVKYGNTLSASHQRALMCIVARFTMLASGTYQGRYAYDLPCGGGKTQAVVAWCSELHHQDQPYSVAVCASRVEPLCDIKRALMENGVPDEAVGLLHSYTFDPDLIVPGQPLPRGHASLPATTGNENKRILLVTHQRVQSAGSDEGFNNYMGAPRDFLIWDETLITSRHRSIDKTDIAKGLGYIAPDVQPGGRATNNTALIETIEYLERAWDIIEAEALDQRKTGRKPKPLTLPPATVEQLDLMLRTIKPWGATAPLHQLLEVSQAPIRVVTVNKGGGGVIQYDIVVSPELRNVAILDGSAAILELVALDNTINIDPTFEGNIKDYSNVTIHQLRARSGREATEGQFDKKTKRDDRKMSQEIVEVVKGIPEDEGIILFTFKKTRNLDITTVLQGDLEMAGVDITATLPDGKPRFVWLTWGQETAVSDFRYCRNVLFAGILHRDDNDLAGAIAGQQDDLTVDIDQAQVVRVKRSEIASGLYQAMSRGACRDTINGQAGAMKVWLIHYDKTIKELLDRVMPGAVWNEWTAKYMEAVTYKIEGAAQAIVQHLHGLHADVTKLSTVALKKDVGLADLDTKSWQRAVAMVVELTATWIKDGRSFVRSGSASDHGF